MQENSKKKRTIIGLLAATAILISSSMRLTAMDFVGNVAHGIVDVAGGFEREARQAAERVQRRREALDRQIEQALARPGATQNDPQVAFLMQQRGELQGNIDQLNNLGTQAATVGINVAGQLGQNVVGMIGADQRNQHELDRLATTEAIKNRGWLQMADFFLKPNNLGKIVLAVGGTVALYYTIKLMYEFVRARMNKPTLVRETSVHGMLQDINDYFYELIHGTKKPAAPVLSDIALPAEAQEQLHLLAEDMKESRNFGLTMQNMLFYGPPGTGKTEFAKILAHHSGLDYAIISGPDFRQFKDGEAVTEVHKLFDWLKRGEMPRLVFIDEAEAAFKDRRVLDREGIDIVNAFLSHTGSNSNQFFFIFATNYADELDSAIRSRIHQKFAFNLPTAQQRFDIIKLKFAKYIVGDSRTYEVDGQTMTASLKVDEDVTDDFLRQQSERLVGFSGRDIDQAVSEMQIRSYRSGKNLLTREIIEKIFTIKIAQIAADQKINAQQAARKEASDKKLMGLAGA